MRKYILELQRLSGINTLTESRTFTGKFNNIFDGKWKDGSKQLSRLYDIYLSEPVTKATDKKYEKTEGMILTWQERHDGTHAPVAHYTKLLTEIEKTHKVTATAVRNSLKDLENYFGLITWGEMQAAPHVKNDMGIGWTTRVEGVIEKTQEPVQFTSCSFYAPGAGQRYYRFRSNEKQVMSRVMGNKFKWGNENNDLTSPLAT